MSVPSSPSEVDRLSEQLSSAVVLTPAEKVAKPKKKSHPATPSTPSPPQTLESVLNTPYVSVKHESSTSPDPSTTPVSLSRGNGTGFLFDERMLLHSNIFEGHLERPDRLIAIQKMLQTPIGARVLPYLVPVKARPASDQELLAVHQQEVSNYILCYVMFVFV